MNNVMYYTIYETSSAELKNTTLTLWALTIHHVQQQLYGGIKTKRMYKT